MAPDPQDEFELDWGDGEGATEPVSENLKMDLDDDGVDVVSLGGDDDDDDKGYYHEQQSHAEDQHTVIQQSAPARASSPSKPPPPTTALPITQSSGETGKPLPASLPQRPPSQPSALTSSSNLLAASAMAPPKTITNGLLPDWEPRTAKSNGGTYYYNKKTHQSTWTKPTKSEEPQTSSQSSGSPVAMLRERANTNRESHSLSTSLPPRPGNSTIANAYRTDRSPSPPVRTRRRRGGRSRSHDRRQSKPDVLRKSSLPPAADPRSVRRPYSPPPTRGMDSYRPGPSPEPQPRRRASLSPGPQRSRRSPDIQLRSRLSPPPSDIAIAYATQRRNKAREVSDQSNRRRSLSPPLRDILRNPRSRSPPIGRRVPISPPHSSTGLPQKRREDVFSGNDRDAYNGNRRDSDFNNDAKRRRVDAFDEDVGLYRRTSDASNRSRELMASGRSSKLDLPEDETSRTKRTPLPPQGERFVTAVIMSSRGMDRRDRISSRVDINHGPTEPSENEHSASRRISPVEVERPGIPVRLDDKSTAVSMPLASAAVVAAYGKRQALLNGIGPSSSASQQQPPPRPQPAPSQPSSTKDANHPDFAGGARLPPSGPAAGITRGGRYGSVMMPAPATSDRDRDRDLPRAPADRIGDRDLPRAPRAMHKVNDDRHYRPDREPATREREARSRFDRSPPLSSPRLPAENNSFEHQQHHERPSQVDRRYHEHSLEMKYDAPREPTSPNLGIVHPSRLLAFANTLTARNSTSSIDSLPSNERNQIFTVAVREEDYHIREQHSHEIWRQQGVLDISGDRKSYHQGFVNETLTAPQTRPRTRFGATPVDRREELPPPEQSPYRRPYDDRASDYSTAYEVQQVQLSPIRPSVRRDPDDLRIDIPYREPDLYSGSIHGQQIEQPLRRRVSPSPLSAYSNGRPEVLRHHSPPLERPAASLATLRRDSLDGMARDIRQDDDQLHYREGASHFGPQQRDSYDDYPASSITNGSFSVSRFGDNTGGYARPHPSDILLEARRLDINDRHWDRNLGRSDPYTTGETSPRYAEEALSGQGSSSRMSREADHEMEAHPSMSPLERERKLMEPPLRRESSDNYRTQSPPRVPLPESPRGGQPEPLHRDVPTGSADGLSDSARQTDGSSHAVPQSAEKMDWAPERRTAVRLVRRPLSPPVPTSPALRDPVSAPNTLISSGGSVPEPKTSVPQVPGPPTPLAASASLFDRISSGPSKTDHGSLRRRMDTDRGGTEEGGERKRKKGLRRGPGGGR
ncbi:hypothetical protein FRB95_013432 [Tulasnella sp. JGI-2019a]|nr:hypothetical protein FRB95_013432 [Tulasnella sp. JGI-2019a]